MATLKFEAGRLLCSHIRQFLKECKFMGRNIEWMEGAGFFSRDFLIKGSDEDIVFVNRSIDAWTKENNINE